MGGTDFAAKALETSVKINVDAFSQLQWFCKGSYKSSYKKQQLDRYQNNTMNCTDIFDLVCVDGAKVASIAVVKVSTCRSDNA